MCARDRLCCNSAESGAAERAICSENHLTVIFLQLRGEKGPGFDTSEQFPFKGARRPFFVEFECCRCSEPLGVSAHEVGGVAQRDTALSERFGGNAETQSRLPRPTNDPFSLMQKQSPREAEHESAKFSLMGESFLAVVLCNRWSCCRRRPNLQ